MVLGFRTNRVNDNQTYLVFSPEKKIEPLEISGREVE